MGCFWSSESDLRDRYGSPPPYSPRRPPPTYRSSDGPYFGEYRCSHCRRTWSSRLSWRNTYQICKRCRGRVNPHFQRALVSSDRTAGKGNNQDHPKELCQRCQQLGRYCGSVGKRG